MKTLFNLLSLSFLLLFSLLILPQPTFADDYTVSGSVYIDSNNNDTKDYGEGYTGGATVCIEALGIGSGSSHCDPYGYGVKLDPTQTTNSSGDYSFTKPYAGGYSVVLTIPSGYRIVGAYVNGEYSNAGNSAVIDPSGTIDFKIRPITCGPSSSTAYVGNSVTWSVSSGGESGYSFSWSGTDDLSGGSSTASKTYSSTGTKTASVSFYAAGVQYSADCSSTSISYPPITASCSASSTAARDTEPVTWTATPGGGNGSYTYSWSGTDSLSGSSSSVTKSYSSTGSKSGSVTIASAGSSTNVSCSNTAAISTMNIKKLGFDYYPYGAPSGETPITALARFGGNMYRDYNDPFTGSEGQERFRLIRYNNSKNSISCNGATHYFVYSGWTKGTFNASASTDTFTIYSGSSLSNGSTIVLSGTLPSGANSTTAYYVRDSSSNTFKIATSSGGPAIDITSDVTDHSGSWDLMYCPSAITTYVSNHTGLYWQLGNEVNISDQDQGLRDNDNSNIFTSWYHEIAAAVRSGDSGSKIIGPAVWHWTPYDAGYTWWYPTYVNRNGSFAYARLFNTHLTLFGSNPVMDFMDVHVYPADTTLANTQTQFDSQIGPAKGFADSKGIGLMVLEWGLHRKADDSQCSLLTQSSTDRKNFTRHALETMSANNVYAAMYYASHDQPCDAYGGLSWLINSDGGLSPEGQAHDEFLHPYSTCRFAECANPPQGCSYQGGIGYSCDLNVDVTCGNLVCENGWDTIYYIHDNN